MQIADLEIAREFWGQVSVQIPENEYDDLDKRLKYKSDQVRSLLIESDPFALSFNDINFLLRSSFASRRKAKEILGSLDLDDLREGLADLVQSSSSIEQRTYTLRKHLERFPSAQMELPFELLHNLYPDRYWPWSKWIWNPDSNTGALRLLVSEECELFGRDDFETYELVCAASDFLFHTLAAAGLGVDIASPFSFDIFVAGVYATYMSTVLEMRMTKEFNQIVPSAVELAARLLGIYKLKVGL